jgi:hypothetical protein
MAGDQLDRIIQWGEYLPKVLREVPEDFEDTDRLLYMVRVYIRSEGAYYYKVGYTDDLPKRIRSINCQYDACGRIIPVMLTKTECQKNERQGVHKFLDAYRANNIIIGQSKKGELYKISAECYDHIKKSLITHSVLCTKCKGSGDLCEKCEPIFFESQYYIIEDGNNESLYIGGGKYIGLSDKKAEDEYWGNYIWGEIGQEHNINSTAKGDYIAR